MNTMELLFNRDFICNYCGEEIERGMMSFVRHASQCKRDAPNESISSHHEKIRIEKMRENHKLEDDVLFAIMTDDERFELVCLSTNGIYNGRENTILVGRAQFDKIHDYRDKMKLKYHTVK